MADLSALTLDLSVTVTVDGRPRSWWRLRALACCAWVLRVPLRVETEQQRTVRDLWREQRALSDELDAILGTSEPGSCTHNVRRGVQVGTGVRWTCADCGEVVSFGRARIGQADG